MTRSRSMRFLLIAYAFALGVGAGTLEATAHLDPLLSMFLADLAATLAIFACSVFAKNSSVYDPYWSAAPIAIVGWWALAPDGALTLREGLLLAAVSAWGLRLTWNFLSGWPGMEHEDWRYRDLRAKSGRLYWLVSLTGIHGFPTLVVFAGLLPAYYATDAGGAPGWLDGLALAVCLAATAIESISDAQLRAFRARNPPPGSFVDEGLWRYSRHPNYFGEMLFWWGVWLFGLAAAPAAWWAIAGPLAVTGLFVFISVPMTDERTLASRPHYAEHMERVSGLVPLPRRG